MNKDYDKKKFEKFLLKTLKDNSEKNINSSVAKKINSKDFTMSIMDRINNDKNSNIDVDANFSNKFLNSSDLKDISYINVEESNDNLKIINLFKKINNENHKDSFNNESINNESIIESENIKKIDDLLKLLKNHKEASISNEFTSNVMERINDYQPVVYNESNIQDVLKGLRTKRTAIPSDDFSKNVIKKIEESSILDDSSYSKIFKKFIIGSIAVAAASIILAFSFFSDYNADTAEFMATDYYNTGLY